MLYLTDRVGDALKRPHAPTLVVWGRQPVHPPVESADLWLRALPEAELEVVAEAGVLPHAERPQKLAELVGRFYDALPG